MKIEISVPRGHGSISEVSRRVEAGLKLDGYELDSTGRVDATLYFGSIPPLRHLKHENKQLLFVHGAVEQEFRCTPGEKRFVLWPYWKLLRRWGAIDHYIYHSFSSLALNEGTRAGRSPIILPQFLIEDEIGEISDRASAHESPLIVTYTSTVASPRLLGLKDIVLLFRTVRGLARREFKVIIISPSTSGFDVGWLKVLPLLPRDDYLRLIAKADIYLERCTDEEIGYGTLEAAQAGITVAKATLVHGEHQDYDSNAMLLSGHLDGLASKIADYIDHPEPQYRESMLAYLRRKRTWDEVKTPLLRSLDY